MVDGLAVGTDEVNALRIGLLEKFPDGPGVELAQVGAQQAHLPASALFAGAHIQNGLAGGHIEGLKIEAQLLHLRVRARAGDPGEDGVHAIGGGAAHQPHHQAGILIPKIHKWVIHR